MHRDLLWYVPLILLWAALTWWSWRTVRRHEVRTGIAGLRAIPGLGMGGWGLAMWLYMAFRPALDGAGDAPLADALGQGQFWREVLRYLAVGLPIWMWGDFMFRRLLILFFGVRPLPAGPPSEPAE